MEQKIYAVYASVTAVNTAFNKIKNKTKACIMQTPHAICEKMCSYCIVLDKKNIALVPQENLRSIWEMHKGKPCEVKP